MNLRIGYLVQWSGGPETGVFKKVVAQTREWVRMGAEVCLFVLSRPEAGHAWSRATTGVPVHLQVFRRTLDAFRGMRTLARAALSWKPDVIYARLGLYYPVLGVVGREVPLVFEINSDDFVESRIRSYPRHLSYKFACHFALRNSAGMVAVTNELMTNPRLTRYGKPMVVVSNGVDLASIPECPVPNNDRPRLLFIGSPDCPWHGIDKIIWLAQSFPQWDFDLIGISPSQLPSDMPQNVTAHGVLTADNYRAIVARADLALGPLALHRKSMNEACPLKVREYLAYGIPTIIGYKDTDFPRKVSFILELPNTPRNVVDHVDDIEQFVSRMRGVRVDRESIAHLDYSRKEASRLAFLNWVLSQHRRGRAESDAGTYGQ